MKKPCRRSCGCAHRTLCLSPASSSGRGAGGDKTLNRRQCNLLRCFTPTHRDGAASRKSPNPPHGTPSFSRNVSTSDAYLYLCSSPLKRLINRKHLFSVCLFSHPMPSVSSPVDVAHQTERLFLLRETAMFPPNRFGVAPIVGYPP